MDMRAVNQRVIEEFRANGGQVGGQLQNTPLLLLTTTGARTGRRHTTPVMYLPDGDRLVVFASVMGAPSHPDWYHNLVAHPDVTVEVGAESFQATARVAAGEERARLWAKAAEQYPFLTEHQAKTSRQIPVVVLAPKAG